MNAILDQFFSLLPTDFYLWSLSAIIMAILALLINYFINEAL